MKVHPSYNKNTANHCTAPPARWRVRQRNCNHSAFSGYHETPSQYSGLVCLECHHTWRSKAGYVKSIADLKPGDGWP